MIKVDNKIRNIYYMLCYSFFGERLNAKEQEKLGAEAFNNIYNLFSLLLCLLLKKQIKKGIYKNYSYEEKELRSIVGKINVNESIKNNSIINKKMICQFDEFTDNVLLNRIIKTTIYYLIKSNKIGKETKEELRKINVYFSNVDLIDIKAIKWDLVRFNRNNISYKYCFDLCKLILNGLIVSDNIGNNYFKEFLDDTRVSAIYENFLKAFFRKHYPELNAKSKILNLLDIGKRAEYIPAMKTDITLEYEGRKLIIDAKFYSKILKENNAIRVKSRVISNGNIYQILAYVDNQDKYKEGKVYGMLLYAQTINEPALSQQETLNGHKIFFRTIDLNDDWEKIEYRLNSIANCFINDSFQ